MRRLLTIAGGVLIIALVVVLAGASLVSAQDEPTTPEDPAPSAVPDDTTSPWPFGPRGGFGGRFGGGPGMGRGLPGVDQEAMHEAIAAALGITVDEFEAAIEDGTTLNELAEEQDVDMADVQAAILEVRQQALQQAVEDGLLTQEEADALAEHLDEIAPGRFTGPCIGFGGPRGPFPGGPRGGGFGGRFDGDGGLNGDRLQETPEQPASSPSQA